MKSRSASIRGDLAEYQKEGRKHKAVAENKNSTGMRHFFLCYCLVLLPSVILPSVLQSHPALRHLVVNTRGPLQSQHISSMPRHAEILLGNVFRARARKFPFTVITHRLRARLFVVVIIPTSCTSMPSSAKTVHVKLLVLSSLINLAVFPLRAPA